MSELGVRPSRKLGQNFLIDPNSIQRICRCSDVEPGDLVVEIGPGTGAMTHYLLEQDIDLVAIEYDARLADFLEERYSDRPNFKLVRADASRVDFDELTEGRPWKCNANLPYSVSTVILTKIACQKNLPKSMTLLLQKEMADRIASDPGCKSYGSLSVRLQALFTASIAGTVKPTVFWPPPEVDSAILTLKLTETRMTPEEYLKFDSFVKYCFAQRRKKLRKRLLANAPEPDVNQAFQTVGLDIDVRAEQLTVNDFVSLFSVLSIRQP